MSENVTTVTGIENESPTLRICTGWASNYFESDLKKPKSLIEVFPSLQKMEAGSLCWDPSPSETFWDWGVLPPAWAAERGTGLEHKAGSH